VFTRSTPDASARGPRHQEHQSVTETIPLPGPLLQTTELSVSFGGVHAVDRVSLSVGAGELVGVIGPNGAGKTTTIDALTGVVPARGRVHLAGEDISSWAPARRARAGLARTWQSVELFDDLSVAENCRVAAAPPAWRRALHDLIRPSQGSASDGVDDTVLAALDEVGLADAADRQPAQLSLGQRKLAGLARALAADPCVLLLDEPAAGLDTDESEALGAVLRRLVTRSADEGERARGMVLIDHDMGLVLSVCDRVYVLEFGRVIAEGTPGEIRRDERVVAAYLGSAGEAAP
jgi:ABC-type branched-subunit amino acid transport system ATPase component